MNNEPKSTVPLDKPVQVIVRAEFHVHAVFVNMRVPFVVEKARYSMAFCLVQFAHDFDFHRYIPDAWFFLPIILLVRFFFDCHLLPQSLVSW